MQYYVEVEREEDGRWIADIPALPGVSCYGVTPDDAIRQAETLALCVIAEQLQHARR